MVARWQHRVHRSYGRSGEGPGVPDRTGSIENAISELPQVKDRLVMVRQDGPERSNWWPMWCRRTARSPRTPSSGPTAGAASLPVAHPPAGACHALTLPGPSGVPAERKWKGGPACIFRHRRPDNRSSGPAMSPPGMRMRRHWPPFGPECSASRTSASTTISSDLGGHSLLGIQLFTQVKQEMGYKLPLATLFRSPTIAQLSGSSACPSNPRCN